MNVSHITVHRVSEWKGNGFSAMLKECPEQSNLIRQTIRNHVGRRIIHEITG
jgi:hypothetical protein